MADTRKYPGVKAARLTAGVSSGDTSMTLSAIEDRQGNTLTMTDFGSKGYAVVDPGGTNEEYVVFTGISSTTVSGISTQSATASYAETSGFANAHAAGVKVILMTNSPGFYDTFANKNNDETILKTWTFTSTEIPIFDSDPTLTDDKHICTKKYADDLAIAGAPDITESVKGIAELASISELSAGTATGGTGANLVPHAEDFGNTSSAKQMVPVTDADGDIPVEFMELDANWTFTGELDVATATNFKLGGVAYTGSMADLNEAETFFGATDITGAEAEELTDGSDTSLHQHSLFSRMNGSATSRETVSYIDINDRNYFTESAAGTQTENLTYLKMVSGAGAGNGVCIEEGAGLAHEIHDWDNDFSLGFSFKLGQAADQDVFLGLGAGATDTATGAVVADATLTGRHIGIFVQDATLYASNADGTTQTKTDISNGVTLTDLNHIVIKYDADTNIKFYVNGALAATHTTNRPSGSTDYAFGFGIEEQSAGSGTIYISRFMPFAAKTA